MFRNKSARSHSFAMIPRADIPRSSFKMEKAYKTSFDAGILYPIFVEEVLPGDTWRLKATFWARMATPVFPIMDNLHFESFFFFVPNRLTWDKWQRFQGEQSNPGDTIAFTIPQIASPAGGHAVGSIYDYMGLPTAGQIAAGSSYSHSALPLRAYNQIFNEWFRDQNLLNSVSQVVNDGPDGSGSYALQLRGKRHDYFTSCLPFVQKGTAVSLPLTGDAKVVTRSAEAFNLAAPGIVWRDGAAGAAPLVNQHLMVTNAAGGNPNMKYSTTAATAGAGSFLYPSNLWADLSSATATTINQLRQSFQIQRVLERDARGGTRYTEILRAHFGVVSPDARLQRPEYLGGGHQMVSINPIAQTSATGLTGATTPQGNLSAFGTMLAQGHGFSQSFTEHGYLIGLINVRADLTYQQGLRRHWSRQTRYDYYMPAFAMLGEQAVLNKEIFCQGTAGGAVDNDVFGYQERWAEYRYNPSEITAKMKSTAAGTIDFTHLSQRFNTLPALNSTFIGDFSRDQVRRAVAAGAQADGQQFLLDAFFDIIVARPMPMYSVPGLIDHF